MKHTLTIISLILFNQIVNPFFLSTSSNAGGFVDSFNKSFNQSFKQSQEHTYRMIQEKRKEKRQQEQDKFVIQLISELNSAYETYLSSFNKNYSINNDTVPIDNINNEKQQNFNNQMSNIIDKFLTDNPKAAPVITEMLMNNESVYNQLIAKAQKLVTARIFSDQIYNKYGTDPYIIKRLNIINNINDADMRLNEVEELNELTFGYDLKVHLNNKYKMHHDTSSYNSQTDPNKDIYKNYLDNTLAYKTVVRSKDYNTITLENDAVLEVIGYLGYLGYRPEAILFGSGSYCNIWIDEQLFQCKLLKKPYGITETARNVTITDVTGDGSIIKLLDGSIYEVNMLYTIYTSLWLDFSRGLLINDTELINLWNGKLIKVTRLK